MFKFKRLNRLVKSSLFLLLLPLAPDAFAQGKLEVTGKVTDSLARPVAYASILVKDVADSSVVAYTASNEEGAYEVSLPHAPESVFFVIKMLGYRPGSFILSPANLAEKRFRKDVVLFEENIGMEEVVIKGKRTIVIKEDTVVFHAEAFLTGGEYVLEDLLAKLPGITVDAEGKVTVNGREVKTIKIDNDDLFGRAYKIVSKSLTVEAVEEVEVLENYAENQITNGYKPSGEVALNLKLKENFKNVFFGKISLHGGNDKYKAHLDPVLLNKSFKLFSTNSANNAADYIYQDLFVLNEETVKEKFFEAVGLRNEGPVAFAEVGVASLSKERFLQNNTINNNLNTLVKLGSGTRLKFRFYHLQDKRSLEESSLTNYKVDKAISPLASNTALSHRNQSILTQLSLEKAKEGAYYLNYEIGYALGRVEKEHSIQLAEQDLAEKVKNQKFQFTNKITFSKKVSRFSSVNLVGVSIFDGLTQNYFISPVLSEQAKPVTASPTYFGTYQQTTPDLSFHGFFAELLSTHGKITSAIKAGYNHYQQKAANRLFEKITLSGDSAENYTSSYNFINSGVFLESEISFEHKKLKLTAGGMIGRNSLFTPEKRTGMPYQGEVSAKYKLQEGVEIFAKYLFGRTVFNTADFAGGLTRIDYLSFREKSLVYALPERSTYILGMKKGAFNRKLLFNFFYIRNGFKQELKDSYVYNEQIAYKRAVLVPGSTFNTVSSNVDYFLPTLSSNLKLTASIANSESFYLVNDKTFTSTATFANSELSLRSAFKGFFNYHVGIDVKLNRIQNPLASQFNSATFSFLDLNFTFNKSFSGITSFELYSPSKQVDKNYLFWDLRLRYNLPAIKSSVYLDCQNILNNKVFTERILTDLYDIQTQNRLNPFFFLAGYSFNF